MGAFVGSELVVTSKETYKGIIVDSSMKTFSVQQQSKKKKKKVLGDIEHGTVKE